VFNRGTILTEVELLPSFLRVEEYSRSVMRERFGETCLLPTPLHNLHVLDGQQSSIRRLVSMLCERHVAEGVLPDNHGGLHLLFAKATTVIQLHVMATGVVSQVTRVDYTFKCVPLLLPGYCRVNLTGRRAGQARSMEWVHRIVCWARNGPPPGNDYTKYISGHLCGNKQCICPMHLQWMTPKSNAACRDWHKRCEEFERNQGLHVWGGPFNM
jgi:hypothetical protein